VAWRYRRVRGRRSAWPRDGSRWFALPPSACSISPRSRVQPVSCWGSRHPNCPPIGRLSQSVAPRVERTVQIKAGAHGHYVASAEINGRPHRRSRGLGGIDRRALPTMTPGEQAYTFATPDYTQRVSTANGLARVGAGDARPASVVGEHHRAQCTRGRRRARQSRHVAARHVVLGRLRRVDMRSGTLVLQE